MKGFILVLWPSFIVAAVAEIVFFALVDPQQLYLFGEPVNFSRVATYSIGFLALWVICAASSGVTLFFGRGSNEINNRRLLG